MFVAALNKSRVEHNGPVIIKSWIILRYYICRDKMKIDFHEFRDLGKISCSYSLDTFHPGVLCTSPSSTLLCAAVEATSRASKVRHTETLVQSNKDIC